jgi:hypothetical protein
MLPVRIFWFAAAYRSLRIHCSFGCAWKLDWRETEAPPLELKHSSFIWLCMEASLARDKSPSVGVEGSKLQTHREGFDDDEL